MTRHPASLERVQNWIQTAVMHPDGVEQGVAAAQQIVDQQADTYSIDRVILPSKSMSPLERLQIYGRAYFGRLIECLQAQFPSVRHAVGEQAFDSLAFGYLTEHASRDFSLESLGHSFDQFLSATRPPRSPEADAADFDFAEFVIELARLEWNYSQAYSSRGPENSNPLRATEFEAMTADDFANCQLIPFDCVRLLELQYPVHEYASSLRQGKPPVVPSARHVYLVIARRDYVVRRFEVTRPQWILLSAICSQASIGQSLLRLVTETDLDIEQLAIDVRSWFRDWSAAPLFVEVWRANVSRQGIPNQSE